MVLASGWGSLGFPAATAIALHWRCRNPDVRVLVSHDRLHHRSTCFKSIAVLQRHFNPFFEGEKSRPVPEGTGLDAVPVKASAEADTSAARQGHLSRRLHRLP